LADKAYSSKTNRAYLRRRAVKATIAEPELRARPALLSAGAGRSANQSASSGRNSARRRGIVSPQEQEYTACTPQPRNLRRDCPQLAV
jgi:hypothetical protein